MDLAHDDEAWSQAVTCFGEMLRDCDEALPSSANWSLKVTEGTREVLELSLATRRY